MERESFHNLKMNGVKGFSQSKRKVCGRAKMRREEWISPPVLNDHPYFVLLNLSSGSFFPLKSSFGFGRKPHILYKTTPSTR